MSDRAGGEERARALDLLAYSSVSERDRADAFDVAGDAWEEAGFPERGELRRGWALDFRHGVVARRSGRTQRVVEEAVQHAVEHALHNVLILCTTRSNAENIEERVRAAIVRALHDYRGGAGPASWDGSPWDIDRRIYVSTARELDREPISLRPVYFGHVLADNEYIEHPHFRGFVDERVLERVRRDPSPAPRAVHEAPSRRLWRRRV